MSKVSFYVCRYTEDGLELPMVHFDPGPRDLCVIFIHGMTGCVENSFFATEWAEMLNDEGIGFLFEHNRGYSVISSMHIKGRENSILRGTSYDIFEECVYDIDLAINEARRLGYKKIILLGHSIGCNKLIYYVANRPHDIAGLIMASMPDMHSFHERMNDEAKRKALMKEALDNVEAGEPDRLLSKRVNDWIPMGSAAYIDWFREDSPLDNIPLHRNPEKWDQLAKVDIPVLTFSGGDEDKAIFHHMDIIKDKALKCPDFQYAVIPFADHQYRGQEREAGKVILRWIRRTISV